MAYMGNKATFAKCVAVPVGFSAHLGLLTAPPKQRLYTAIEVNVYGTRRPQRARLSPVDTRTITRTLHSLFIYIVAGRLRRPVSS